MNKPLLKFCSAESAEKILAKECMFITSPLDLNDAFEMRPGWGEDHERQSEANESERLGYLKSSGGLSPDCQPFTNGPLDQQVRIADGQNGSIFKELHSVYRVLSFVERQASLELLPQNPEHELLMWAHYADKFQGVCIELDEGQFYNGFLKSGFRVTYNKERHALPPSFYDIWSSQPAQFRRDHFVNILTNKSPIWAYENERRMIYDLSELRDSNNYIQVKSKCKSCRDKGRTEESCTSIESNDAVKIPAASVKSVIFGTDCTATKANRILQILAQSPSEKSRNE
jgi:Protein of unknown function (DUF2971)